VCLDGTATFLQLSLKGSDSFSLDLSSQTDSTRLPPSMLHRSPTLHRSSSKAVPTVKRLVPTKNFHSTESSVVSRSRQSVRLVLFVVDNRDGRDVRDGVIDRRIGSQTKHPSSTPPPVWDNTLTKLGMSRDRGGLARMPAAGNNRGKGNWGSSLRLPFNTHRD